MFWDASDDFEFQKNVVLGNSTNECQSNIWYIEFLDMWVTTDQTNALNVWNLAEDALLFSLKSERMNSTIIELAPMAVIKLVAAASMDKKVLVWDFMQRSIILEIKLPNGGVHSMVFSTTFQTLITAGFENTVSLWEISPHYFDHTLRGRLVGHRSMISAVGVIERTPMVISADDTGHLKVWDIRTFRCLQTLELGHLTVVSQFINMYEIGKFGFTGTRVNLLDFEDAFEVKHKFNSENQLWPIRVEYNSNVGELIVCTSKEIQFIDVSTGRIKKIFSGLLKDSEDEITAFRLVHQNKKFILGDQHGHMALYLYATGERLKTLKNHTNEITSIKADYGNKMIISSSLDSSIIIQKENKLDFEVKRRAFNAHYRKQIVLMETSIYHNLFVTGAADNVLYVWDYEYAKLVGSITIEDDAEPTAIQFINGYSIIIISTTHGTIHFFHFSKKESSNMEIKHIGIIDMDPRYKNATMESFFANKGSVYANRLLIDLQYDHEGVKKPEKALLYTSLNDGKVTVFNIKSLFDHPEVVLVGHASTKKNYNAGRTTNENFEEAVTIYKLCHGTLHIPSFTKPQLEGECTPVNASLVFPMSPQGQKGGKQTFSSAFQQFSTTNLGQGRPKHDTRSNTGLFKLQSGDSISVSDSLANASEMDAEKDKGGRKFIDLSAHAKISFKAHKDALTTLLFMAFPDKKLLTGSLDSFVKIWELNGVLVASLNVNHPLPMEWKLQTFSIDKIKKQILYGVKIIETIFKRHKGKIHLSEEKNININNFLNMLEQKSSDTRPKAVIETMTKIYPKPVLMKEEYEPRDLHYNNVKDLYKREIRGKTLKEIDFIRGLAVAQDSWKENKKDFIENENNPDQYKKKYDGGYFEIDIMGYLLGDPKSKMNLKNETKTTTETKQLAVKLDAKISALRRTGHLTSLTLDKERSSTNKRPLESKKTASRLIFPVETPSKIKAKAVRSGTIENDLTPDAEPASAMLSFQTGNSKGSKNLLTEVLSPGLPKKNPDTNSALGSLSPASLYNKKASISQKSIENFENTIQVIPETSAEYEKRKIRMKKRSLPSISFYEYAGQKNYTNSPSGHSTNMSTDLSLTYKKKLLNNEFRGILSQLDRKLKKSQLSNSSMYIPMTNEFEDENSNPPQKNKASKLNNRSISYHLPKIGSMMPSKPSSMKPEGADFRDRFRKFAENESKIDLKADLSRDITRNESQINGENMLDNSIKAYFYELPNAATVKAYNLLNVPHKGETHHRSVGRSFDSMASSIKNTTLKGKASFFKETGDSFSELSTDNFHDFPSMKIASRDKLSQDDLGNKSP